ncbi:MAG: hypothetical protein RDU20_11745 [Desulfomonilaceae bacterium]|nr:hypothetical protein [Desulfomonilaceae bacterium]
MRNVTVVKVIMVSVALCMLLSQPGRTEDATEPSNQDEADIMEQPGRLFDMQVPEGFEPVPTDEAGILKWKKDSAEIYLVVGDLFVESGDELFKALRKAAGDGKNLDKVETVKIEGGQAMLLKEKPPGESERPMTWRLVIVLDKKVINVDFTAPAKDFDRFRGDFMKALDSFRLKTDS